MADSPSTTCSAPTPPSKPPPETRVHRILGFVSERQGRLADALSHAEQALALAQAIGDQAGQAASLNSVGWCHALLGDHQRAWTFCQQALAIYHEIGNRYGLAATWDGLAYAEYRLGRLRDAATCYEHVISLFHHLGNRVSEAAALTHLGDIEHAAGDSDAASDAWQQALDILDDLHHPEARQVRAKLRHTPLPEMSNAHHRRLNPVSPE
jgi:tetratricopeptide (TPR) repeat protein